MFRQPRTIPKIPDDCWQRLPDSSDGLISAAKDYYQTSVIIAIVGSQAEIQTLPLLRKYSKVGVLFPAYAEHGYSWKKAGHSVTELSIEAIDIQIEHLDVLIVINPQQPDRSPV